MNADISRFGDSRGCHLSRWARAAVPTHTDRSITVAIAKTAKLNLAEITGASARRLNCGGLDGNS